MQKLPSAEKAYNGRVFRSDRRASQSLWKHFTLLQAQVELDRLTIHTETTCMMFHVYALQQENMPIAEDAQVVVTKYKQDKGSENVLEELMTELAQAYQEKTTGLELETPVACGRCNASLRFLSPPPHSRQFCHCCHRLLPSATFKAGAHLTCQDCTPAQGLPATEKETIIEFRATLRRLQNARQTVSKVWKSEWKKVDKYEKTRRDPRRQAIDEQMNVLAAQQKEMTKRIASDPIARNQQVKEAMERDHVLHTEQQVHQRKLLVATMKYLSIYRSILEGAGVVVPSEIVELSEDARLRAAIEHYETEDGSNKRTHDATGFDAKDAVKKQRVNTQGSRYE
ncbi:hypothetical protein Poli38472_013251 [Pythium oligandrum]|uniref:Uncharacterized protein n=1 Tax=Pythium oligandrum TaxID=41045 RepID=A0A8K1C2P7_PYTOL|nr:hypothetical protein Poli38472_013251 [Pythium oligandrum]|eukprot:TMW55360.1 hypothetical protein Poli38472_013251 [Pythium oligandrum]